MSSESKSATEKNQSVGWVSPKGVTQRSAYQAEASEEFENVGLRCTSPTYGCAWERMPISKAGITLIDCDHRTPPAAEEGYPYIAIPQLQDGHVSLDGVRKISHEDYIDWTKKLSPQEHDVIVVRRCNSGQSAYIRKGLKCAIGQNLVVLRADGSQVLPEYLRWMVRGQEWWDEVSKYINVGAVFDSLRCRDIPNFQLPIPPKKAQAKISGVLSAIDDRITLLRETNATLEAIAQALFKSWFVDFDPVHANIKAAALGRAAPAAANHNAVSGAALDTAQNHPHTNSAAATNNSHPATTPAALDPATAALFPNSFQDSELGLIPSGWRVGKVCDLASIKGGRQLEKTDFSESGPNPVFGGAGIMGQTEQANATGLVITVGRVGAYCGQFFWYYGDAWVNNNASRIEPLFQNQGLWLYQWLRQADADIESIKKGAAQPFVSNSDVADMKLIIPVSDVIDAFDAIASPVYEKLQLNTLQVKRLTQLRDTLLPRLISGQLRLPDVQEKIEEALA